MSERFMEFYSGNLSLVDENYSLHFIESGPCAQKGYIMLIRDGCYTMVDMRAHMSLIESNARYNNIDISNWEWCSCEVLDDPYKWAFFFGKTYGNEWKDNPMALVELKTKEQIMMCRDQFEERAAIMAEGNHWSQDFAADKVARLYGYISAEALRYDLSKALDEIEEEAYNG